MPKMCVLVDADHPNGVVMVGESQYATKFQDICSELTLLNVPLSIICNRYSLWTGAAVTKLNLSVTAYYNNKGAELVLSDYYNAQGVGSYSANQLACMRETLRLIKTCYVCANNNPPKVTSYVSQRGTDANTINALKNLEGAGITPILKTNINTPDFKYSPVTIADFSTASAMEFFKSIKSAVDAGRDIVARVSSAGGSNQSQYPDALYAGIWAAKAAGYQFVQYRDF